MHKKYARDGLVCMSVSVDQADDKERVLDFLKEQKATFANYLLDTQNPEERRSILARFAHTVRRDGKTWGGDPATDTVGTNESMKLAHGSDTMRCPPTSSSTPSVRTNETANAESRMRAPRERRMRLA